MIRSFQRKALARYWNDGRVRRLPSGDVPRIRLLLQALDAATGPADLDLPGLGLAAPAAGDRYSLRATTTSRILFGWSGEDATRVELEQDGDGR